MRSRVVSLLSAGVLVVAGLLIPASPASAAPSFRVPLPLSEL